MRLMKIHVGCDEAGSFETEAKLQKLSFKNNLPYVSTTVMGELGWDPGIWIFLTDEPIDYQETVELGHKELETEVVLTV